MTVAIVGRPNVGKSTLFNRLTGRWLAIVDNTPGVTRDWREGDARLGALSFRVIDTAGFEETRGEELAARIQMQTEHAIAAADVVLLLIDARAGVTPLDSVLADSLRRSARPTILAANKYDGGAGEAGYLEAFGLGLGEPVPLAAEHGEGLGMLHEALMARTDAVALTSDDGAEAAAAPAAGEPPLQLAVIGRPNVGKSTLVNRLLGAERLITGPEAGITRDAIAVDWSFQGRAMRLIDTAGLRRRARVTDRIEALATADTSRAIRFAHVVIIVIDAKLGIDKQDLTIAGSVVGEGRAPVIALNKWDLVEDRRGTLARVRAQLDSSLPQARGVRVVPVSALGGEGIDRLLPAVLAAHDIWNRHVATGPLNRWLARATAAHPPPSVQGRPVKLRYVTQSKTRPPTFVLFVNRPADLADTYLRYLSNGLRQTFGFEGVPLRFTTRKTRNPYAG